MEKKIIAIDEYSVRTAERIIKKYTSLFEKLKQAYDSLNLKPLEDKDITAMFQGDIFIKRILLEQVNKEQMQIGNIQLSDEKILSLIEMPKGLEYFITVTKEFLEVTREQENRTAMVHLSDFKLVDGIICFPNYLEKIQARNTWFTNNEKQNEILEILNKTITLFNSTNFDLSLLTLNARQAIITEQNGKHKLNPDFIRAIQHYS